MFKILKAFKGSPDGMQVISYTVGQEVELSVSLGKVALREGWAEDVEKPKPSKPLEVPVVEEVKTQRASSRKRKIK